MKRALPLFLLALAGALALFLMKRPVRSQHEPLSPDANLASEAERIAEALHAVTIESAVHDDDATKENAGRVNAAERAQVRSEEAEIVLRVVSREKQEPLAGVRVLLTPHEPATVGSNIDRFVQAQQQVGWTSAAEAGRVAAMARPPHPARRDRRTMQRAVVCSSERNTDLCNIA